METVPSKSPEDKSSPTTVRTFEQALELRKVGEHTFENVQFPVWSWPGSGSFPGATLMSQSAAAAWRDVGPDFFLDSFQAHFVSGGDPRYPIQYKVEKLSDGGRFATRVVTAKQKDKVRLHVTCSFARKSAKTGPAMKHAVERRSKQTVQSITIDDLDLGRNEYGPYLKTQRLPLEHIGSGPGEGTASPGAKIYPFVNIISPPIEASDSRFQTLGILALSDCHIADTAPTLHGISFGLPEVNDPTQTRTERNVKLYTTLNHTIHFAMQDGFRADDLCYIEATSSWTNSRRGEIQSRIFDRAGRLIATVKQEAYYVLKDKKAESKM